MPSANEAVALAVLEAMACGSAVVLSQIRAFEPLGTDGINGRLVSVGNVKGFAAAIINAWEHRESFGQAAFDTVRTHYNTRVLYFQLAESLRDCLRQRRSTMIRNAGSVDLVLLSKSGWRNLN